MTANVRTNTTPADDVVGYDLTILDRGGVSTVPLPTTGTLVIGRDSDATVRLETTRASRRHATLVVDHDAFAIEDLGSSNGTIINRQRLAPNQRTAIDPGDSIQIGELILIVTPRYAGPVRELTDATRSPAFRAVLHQVSAVAPAGVNVLIVGETGVGKDMLARRVHALSPRHGGPFVRINCAALTEGVLESDLFGHEQPGGALAAKPGLLESAARGTVFLDEVGELPEPLQAKLLHAVENRQITRVGSTQVRTIDVRFVAATNRDLSVDTGKRFRSDLYYRLSTFVVNVPPLRERSEDIESLATELIQEAASKFGTSPPALDDGALETLIAYAWPGNVRELRNVIERALVLGQGKPITLDLLPSSLLASPPRAERVEADGTEPLRLSATERAERQTIIQALVDARGNQSEAARALGISRTTLLQRLDMYRISRPRKRPMAPE